MAATAKATRSKAPLKRATVLYLYGISEQPAALPDIAGVDGHSPVESLACGRLTCWISRVSGIEFGSQLAANMENLEWLSRASLRHQQAVAAVHRNTSILPARFGVVFSSERSLAAHVGSRRRQLQARLKRVRGTQEWGVKVFRRSAAASAAAQSGRDYLRRKAEVLKRARSRELAPEVRQFAQALQKVATASAPVGSVSGAQPGLEWQASFLVAGARQRAWDQLIAQHRRRWQDRFHIECTGPWPPYSFV